MRSLSFIGVVLLIGVITCATIGIAVAEEEQMCVPMGIITLQPPDAVEAKRASVALITTAILFLPATNVTTHGTAKADHRMYDVRVPRS
jgi:hypothetical protein